MSKPQEESAFLGSDTSVVHSSGSCVDLLCVPPSSSVVKVAVL